MRQDHKLATTQIACFIFFDKGKIIIISNGFTKKTNKTPTKEIELAKKYREDYLRRDKNELQQL